MKSITRPAFTVRELFTFCISTVDDQVDKQDLRDCIDVIMQAEADFDNRFVLNEVHLITRNNTVLGNVGKKEMASVYNYRMVRPGMPGHIYYRTIISSAPQGRCPYCLIRNANTIDHYLPQAKYPIYSITPINLVPCCSMCNTDKKVAYPTSSETQTLHPYYDSIENEPWLKARIIRTIPLGFEYYADPPARWSQIFKDRVINHFNAYELNALYSDHANEEFTEVKQQLIGQYNNGPDELRKHLEDTYRSRLSNGVNGWRPVLYHALLHDDWFCNGGLLT